MSDDFEHIRLFIRTKLGEASNRDLVQHAHDRLLSDAPPRWAQELAALRESDVLEATGTLQSCLVADGLLPDSEQLRTALRTMIREWIAKTRRTGAVETVGVTPSVVALLRLCPGYSFNKVSMPVEEYPYPPVDSPTELAKYIEYELYTLVPP